jgi:hypothetical protein
MESATSPKQPATTKLKKQRSDVAKDDPEKDFFDDKD